MTKLNENEQILAELGLKYKFTCANRDCKCLTQGVGLYFTTENIGEAEKHSRENNSPMWIEVVS